MTATPNFPVLALGPDRYGRDPTNEQFYGFDDVGALSKASREEQRSGARAQWRLMDNRGASFCIVRERALQTLTPIWLRILMTLFGQRGAIEDTLELEFGVREGLTFDEAKARVWASILRNPEEWSDEEVAADAARPPRPLADILQDAKAAVDAAQNVEDLFRRLDAAWPV
ncbi:MAG: hypothetical protein ACJ798_13365 [Phenylobacterium sp.]